MDRLAGVNAVHEAEARSKGTCLHGVSGPCGRAVSLWDLLAPSEHLPQLQARVAVVPARSEASWGGAVRPLKKYPRTPHLFPSAAVTKDDRVLSPAQAEVFLATPLTVTEKVDGANVGISFDLETGRMLLQSRGHYLRGKDHPQFDLFKQWAWEREQELRDICGIGVLYGEWMYAEHAIWYTDLPDYFLVFGLLEGERWATRPEIEALLDGTGIYATDLVAEDVELSPEGAWELASGPSAYYNGPREGIILSVEYEDLGVMTRAKLIRPGFLQPTEAHWTKRRMKRNLLAGEA